MSFGKAQLVARVGAERVVGGEFDGHLLGQRGTQSARHVDAGQLLEFVFGLCGQLHLLARHVCRFRVRLRAHRHILTRRHGERAGHQPCQCGHHHRRAIGLCRGHADHETAGGNQSVIGAQDRRAQPADAAALVGFRMDGGHERTERRETSRANR